MHYVNLRPLRRVAGGLCGAVGTGWVGGGIWGGRYVVGGVTGEVVVVNVVDIVDVNVWHGDIGDGLFPLGEPTCIGS